MAAAHSSAPGWLGWNGHHPHAGAINLRSKLSLFLAELKRRKVLHSAAAYAVVGFGAIEGIGLIQPTFGFSPGVYDFIVLLVVLGFPVALVLSWFIEITPSGLQRTVDLTPEQLAAPFPGKPAASSWVFVAVSFGVVLVAGYFVFFQGGQGDDRPRVAVLPCENFITDPDYAHFAAQLHDEILLKLEKVSSLFSIGRTSVRQYALNPPPTDEIAIALSVGFVGECSVQKSGSMIRLIFQLLEGSTGGQVWADHYDWDLTVGDLFDIQSEVAQQVAMEIGAEITPDEQARIEARPTESLEAYDLYVLGRDRIRLQSDGQLTLEEQAQALQDAIGFFGEAVRADSSYAMAYAAIAEAYVLLTYFTSDPAEIPEVIRRAKEAVARAETLDPNLPEAHYAHGFLAYRYDWDWETAERELHRALQINPGDARTRIEYATLLASLGRPEEALSEATRAAATDPFSADVGLLFGLALWNGGRIREAEEQLRRTGPMYPIAWSNLLLMAAAEGLPLPDPEALGAIRQAFGEDLADDLTLVVNAVGDPNLRPRAAEVVRENTSLLPPSSFMFWFWSSWFPFVGGTDEGIEQMRQMISAQNPFVAFFSWQLYRSYHEDPRYLSILDDLGLPLPSRGDLPGPQ